MKRPKYYYGIFKVSPNNANPTFYQKGDEWYDIIKPSADAERKSDLKLWGDLEKLGNGLWEDRKARIERDYRMKFCKKENEVFYVCDGTTFEIIEETYDVWDKGEFSKSVQDMMARYGIKYDRPKRSYAERIRTDSTMEDLKESIRITEELNKIPAKRWKEVEDYFKNPNKPAQES